MDLHPCGDTAALFTLAGLTNGTTYTLSMRTLSAGLGDETLESEASDSVSFIPIGQPLPPTNLSAEVGDQSAIIDFDNTNTGNGAEITNYLISLDNGPFVALDPAISSGPVTLTDLTNDQTYSVALQTQTGSGEQALFSEPSETLSFTPESGASVPDAPTDVALTPGDQQLSVSFTPGSDNGSAITNYAYQINGGRWIDLNPASQATHLSLRVWKTATLTACHSGRSMPRVMVRTQSLKLQHCCDHSSSLSRTMVRQST